MEYRFFLYYPLGKDQCLRQLLLWLPRHLTILMFFSELYTHKLT